MNTKCQKNKFSGFLFSLFFMAICIISGCNQDEEFNQNSNLDRLSLIAPNGQKIAKNFSILQNEASLIIENNYGERKEFEITELIYHPMNKGYLVEVKYLTYDGIEGNYIKTDNSSEISNTLENMKNEFAIRLKSGTESEGGSTTTVYSCKNNNSQKCPDCEVVISITNGYKNVRCNCSQGDRTVCVLVTKSI